MPRPVAPWVGILPAGALGVAFFHHLTDACRRVDGRVVFLARRTGGGAERWRPDQPLRVETERGRVEVPMAGVLGGTLLEAARAGRLPRLVLVCTNPDQLFDVLAEYVGLVEHEHAAGRLHGRSRLPLLLLCANGIYHQRVRSSFIELLEEATLLGRLPDLWPDLMPAIVGRLMRAVTIQTALRQGSGPGAVYRPGPSGRTLLTGGDRAARAQAAARLAELGAWFEDAGAAPPTRVEFDKALVNLASNVFGQLAAIGPDGGFRALTVAEIATPARLGRVRELVENVLRVGRGVGVYGPAETAADVLGRTLQAMQSAAAHVPSSVQWLEQQLAAGPLEPRLAPTETWLLKPLQHYARSLGDAVAIAYFEALEAELLAAIARARPRGG